MTTLKEKTVSAMKWSYVSMFTGLALQLVFAAILSRLLTREQFGVWTTAVLLQRFGQFISDMGIGQALVQKAQITSDDVRAGFTASMILGVLATTTAWFIAPAAGHYFKNPELVPIFRSFAFIYVFSSAIVISNSLLRRALNFRPIVISEITMYVLGHGVLGLGAAYLGFGTYSFVISAFAQVFIQLVILYAATRHSLRPIFRWSAYQGLYAFGTKATLVSLLEFISGSLDTFLIAKFYNPSVLALYNRTFTVIAQPAMGFAYSLSRVLAPSFSAMQNDPPRLRWAYLSGFRALALVIGTAIGCIVVDSPEIVKVMLGSQYLDGIALMQILALSVALAVLTNLSAVLAEATARLNIKIVIQAVYVVALLAALWTAYRMGGDIETFAAVMVGAALCRSLAFALMARQIINGGGRSLAASYGLALACGLGSAALTALVVVPLRAVLPLPALFMLEVLLGGVMVAGVVLLGPPSELKAMARKSLTRLRGRGASPAS